ncbi:hypothetical protein ACL7TT_17415 [Microbulbifer sp. 2304DJ12-6]|uniref:hypothetical protein n=1 Tax=Microbulbifer sp. 2304DJ12-6 TaxID=3233340 RepID=UPI0039AFC948
MSDMYKAPQAELTTGEERGDFGSIEKGIAGDYSFSIGEAISESWRLSKGKKRTVWLAVLLYIIALGVISYVAGLITGYPPFDPMEARNASISSAILYQILTIIAGVPLAAGMLMVGIKIARGEETSGTEVFAHFDKIVPLVLATAIMYILVGIGLVLLVIPGLYLIVAYIMAVPLIVDQNLGPWRALETSRKAISKNWFTFFGFLIVMVLLYIAGAIPLLIGLIWVVPLLSIAYGVAYRNMFGGPSRA